VPEMKDKSFGFHGNFLISRNNKWDIGNTWVQEKKK
jgi:hypothetical protein